MRWDDLDVPCRIEIDVHPERPREALPPYVLDSGVDHHHAEILTDLAASDLWPDAETRHRLAVVFRHIILEEAAPVNIYREAAETLGLGNDLNAVRNLVNRYRGRLNRSRGQDLESTEQLGYYLVHVAGVLTEDDLDP